MASIIDGPTISPTYLLVLETAAYSGAANSQTPMSLLISEATSFYSLHNIGTDENYSPEATAALQNAALLPNVLKTKDLKLSHRQSLITTKRILPGILLGVRQSSYASPAARVQHNITKVQTMADVSLTSDLAVSVCKA